VQEETALGEIAKTLARRNINRVPVVDAEGRIRGIVSRDDVLAGMRVREGG
jgi:CBS domain-containing protein